MHCVVSVTSYTTIVVTVYNIAYNDRHIATQDLHTMIATYSCGSIATFTLHQWGHSLAATLHTVTNTYTRFTHNDYNIEWHQYCNFYTTAVATFTSSNIT